MRCHVTVSSPHGYGAEAPHSSAATDWYEEQIQGLRQLRMVAFS